MYRITHAIGGFDREAARSLLNIPDQFKLHAVIAIGNQGKKEILDESLQERENLNTRKPLKNWFLMEKWNCERM